jgi:hypothetical protein
MEAFGKSCLVFVFAVLLFFNGRLASSIVRAKQEHRKLDEKFAALCVKNRDAGEEFALKQDRMRHILSDKNFVERLIWQNEKCVKPSEIVFKFED